MPFSAVSERNGRTSPVVLQNDSTSTPCTRPGARPGPDASASVSPEIGRSSDRRPCCGLRCVRRRGSRCGVVNWLRFCRELERERGVDLEVAQEEGALVETLSPEPTGDLVVALARVAGAARRRDVVERVSTAAGQPERSRVGAPCRSHRSTRIRPTRPSAPPTAWGSGRAPHEPCGACACAHPWPSDSDRPPSAQRRQGGWHAERPCAQLTAVVLITGLDTAWQFEFEVTDPSNGMPVTRVWKVSEGFP